VVKPDQLLVRPGNYLIYDEPVASPIAALEDTPFIMSIIVRTLSEQTYEVVRLKILTGDMSPGTPVRQDAIAAELGVSKIPLREALSRLEQDGLLSSYPNRGYVVRGGRRRGRSQSGSR
jgi:DNA-binding GntR family transcriptional regulator